MIFTSLKLESCEFRNRFVMSAMTRGFADNRRFATEQMCQYYSLRAKYDVALIITEGIIVSPEGDGYISVPHLFNDQHSSSWVPICDAVHSHGSLIAAQLWHCGRISHPDLNSGLPIYSSTDIQALGINRQNKKPFGIPIPMSESDMASVTKAFAHSAQLAIDAGFDFCEVHAGHGYLLDQFLDSNINNRTDKYGGSIQNRLRFPLQVIKAVSDVIGPNRVIVRFSPSRVMGSFHDWGDLFDQSSAFVIALRDLNINIIDISNANADYYRTAGRVVRHLRALNLLDGFTVIAGSSLTREEAIREVRDGSVDLVTWGRSFISNPDLVLRLKNNEPLADFDRSMLSSLI